MQLHNAVIKYPLGQFRDGQYGRYASIAMEVEGYQDLQRVYVNEGASDVQRLSRYQQGDRVQVVRGQTKSGKAKWDFVDDNIGIDDEPLLAKVREVKDLGAIINDHAGAIVRSIQSIEESAEVAGLKLTEESVVKSALSVYIALQRANKLP